MRNVLVMLILGASIALPAAAFAASPQEAGRDNHPDYPRPVAVATPFILQAGPTSPGTLAGKEIPWWLRQVGPHNQER